MYWEIIEHFDVPALLDETWDFFTSVEKLPLITPPWMRFTVLTAGPVRLRGDTEIDYTMRWRGIPMRWRTRIIDWTPQRQFIDVQVRGPYTLWHHQHTFEELPNGRGTRCFDRIIFKPPMGVAGALLAPALVLPSLRDVFRWRRRAIRKHLGWVRALVNPVVMRRL